jgi:hypothetical protein
VACRMGRALCGGASTAPASAVERCSDRYSWRPHVSHRNTFDWLCSENSMTDVYPVVPHLRCSPLRLTLTRLRVLPYRFR